MIDTSLTPPGSIPGELLAALAEETISQEETTQRLEFCKKCEHFAIKEVTKCELCGCQIGLMTTVRFKSCPKGNW